MPFAVTFTKPVLFLPHLVPFTVEVGKKTWHLHGSCHLPFNNQLCRSLAFFQLCDTHITGAQQSVFLKDMILVKESPKHSLNAGLVGVGQLNFHRICASVLLCRNCQGAARWVHWPSGRWVLA